MASRWSAFTKDHFSCLSATLLYRLLKGNSDNVLRSIIQLEREDVLFLFFIDNDAKVRFLYIDTNTDILVTSPPQQQIRGNGSPRRSLEFESHRDDQPVGSARSRRQSGLLLRRSEQYPHATHQIWYSSRKINRGYIFRKCQRAEVSVP